jgi:hypothetical protein
LAAVLTKAVMIVVPTDRLVDRTQADLTASWEVDRSPPAPWSLRVWQSVEMPLQGLEDGELSAAEPLCIDDATADEIADAPLAHAEHLRRFRDAQI